MDKEIDVKLFVTCRLCIEEVGQYQIVPNIQEQFKYCFDINVNPFDGLPQLICQKCKEILNQFSKFKKLYCEKQTDLINKYEKGIQIECTPQHDFVTSSSTLTSLSQNKSSDKINRSELSSESNDSLRHKKRKKIRNAIKSPVKWDYTGFKKEFVCIVCGRGWSSFESLRKHRTAHTKFLAKYPTIFQKKISIVLEKIDGKPNITGMNNIVVHNSNTIIENYNSLCYIKYSKEKNRINYEKSSENLSTISSINVLENSDTEEEIIGKPKIRKRRRVLSGSSSSTDTLVVESNRGLSDNDEYKSVTNHSDVPHSQVTDDQCISIIDSSDSDADRYQIDSTYKAKQTLKTNEDDYKVIEGIIEACVKAYNKKPSSLERSNTHIESQLKNKILSLGRKIINNRITFNSTGLLKYLEHKDLSVIWAKKAISFNSGKDSNYIRIMTKLRGPDESGDNQGWRPVATPNNDISVVEPEQPSVSNEVEKSISNIVHSIQANENSAVLYICHQIDNTSKLLNANPVPYPKQLPRKSTLISEGRLHTTTIDSSSSFQNNEDPNLCMPIITSTTSLSTPNIIENNQNDDPGLVPAPEKHSEQPRIKVKSFSQLMSVNALNNLKNDTLPINILQNRTENPMNILQNNIDQVSTMSMNTVQNNTNMQWPSQELSNMSLPNISSQIPVSQPIQLGAFIPQTYKPINTIPNATRNKEEYGIMNCVDLPNTKTNSPFDYLKNLLLLHNLILFQPPDALDRHFICLIKFKVKFQQESVLDPLILCLSLYCYKNSFCFTVKDRNNINLNIVELSANWQWEIINVFRGDLVQKLLNNALKYSQETFNYTKKFICLLKTVSFKKMP